MAGAACAALVAVLRGGAHRREASRGFQGLRTLDPSEKGRQEVRVLTELENGGDGRAKSTVAWCGPVLAGEAVAVESQRLGSTVERGSVL